jgi:hypothetical protein
MLSVQIFNIDKSIATLRSFYAESMNNKETIHLYLQFTLSAVWQTKVAVCYMPLVKQLTMYIAQPELLKDVHDGLFFIVGSKIFMPFCFFSL